MAQQLFTDIPASAKSIPGSVTPNISADIQQKVDWNAINAALGNSANDWARAAAINSANFGRVGDSRYQGWNTGGSTSASTPSANQSSGYAGGQGAVLWAPRNLEGAHLGTWADQQQKKAMTENRPLPIVLQAHTGDPYSPGEVGGGLSANVLGRGIYGPGLTNAMGVPNPAVWARMWNRKTGQPGGGGTSQAEPADPFPKESLRQRTSPGPQYQFDMFGGR